MSISLSGKRMCLGALYRPPDVNVIAALDDLENIIFTYVSEFDYIVFGGNQNLNISNTTDSYSVRFGSFLEKLGLSQIIGSATRPSTGTLLDVIVKIILIL